MEETPLNIHNTYVIEEGAFTTRQIRYCSVDGELVFQIEDTKKSISERILKVIPLYSLLSSLRRTHFIATAPNREQPLFHVEKKPGFAEHYRIYDENGDFVAQVRSASKWKFQLDVGVYEEHLGTIEGGSGWWTFDSPEGNRYLDYKQNSYLPEYKSKNPLTGPNVAKISNTSSKALSIATHAIPFIIEEFTQRQSS